MHISKISVGTDVPPEFSIGPPMASASTPTSCSTPLTAVGSNQNSVVSILQVSPTPTLQGKSDPALEHFAFEKEGKTCVYTCIHCSSLFRGGGINRMKQYLAGVLGNITSCKKVPHDVGHIRWYNP